MPRYDYLKGRTVSSGKKPNYEQAQALFEKSMAGDEAEDVGAVMLASQTRYHTARMFAEKGDTDGTRDLPTIFHRQFKAWANPVWEKKYRKALSDLKAK